MDIQGMFFSPWKEDADGYGDNVGAYYLSIQNPAPENVAWEVLNSFKGQNNAGVKAREELQRRGYDGVDFGGQEYIAFEPTQIKSATDNIGTFDPSNPDVRFHAGSALPRLNRRNFIAGRAMVAEDYGRGEQTPGALAASRELDRRHSSPIAGRGDLRRISLPISELEQLRRSVTGDVVPAHLARRIPGGAAAMHNKAGRLFMNADVWGVVDKTDMQPIVDNLKLHGFFRNEDPAWMAAHSPVEIAHEKEWEGGLSPLMAISSFFR